MAQIKEIPDNMDLEKVQRMIKENETRIRSLVKELTGEPIPATELSPDNPPIRSAEYVNKLCLKIGRANEETDRLHLMEFYIRHGLKPGQPFMCRGVKVIDISCDFRVIRGTYITEQGTVSYDRMQIYGDISPLIPQDRVTINGMTFTEIPATCGTCPAMVTERDRSIGFCSLFRKSKYRYENIPKWCSSLLEKGFAIGGELTIFESETEDL